ncbi:hypothetical protein UFOVP238_28 [uncultured Caudovirales phage]|uniref:Uncharacterized protein n=1 Tax=uncultured Caudovirales phage TaxID=2100421 RepID=A0A6J7WU39_9CAUD|nr:hypothetical protein UFOVP238_28 [uncultured Caudovirales phage]
MTNQTVKVMTTRDVKALNSLAIIQGFNRALSDYGIANLDPDGIHVVDYTFLHNDDHLRISVLAKMVGTDDPAQVFIDATFEDFDNYTTVIRIDKEDDQ